MTDAPMPPQDWLKKHTDVSDRAAAGAGWQQGWLAGQAATRGQASEPLTPEEHQALQLTADLWNLLNRIVGNDRSRAGDLAEVASHIHNIQHAVLAQAAARAYPDRYRLLGGTVTITAPATSDALEDALGELGPANREADRG